MNRRKIIKKQAIVFALFLMFIGVNSLAYVASSSSYIMQFDSINIGGTNSTTSNYIMEDTAGEIGTGDSSSSVYLMHAGYQNLNEQYISVSAGSDLSLSGVYASAGGTSTASKTITVNTDNPGGYSLYIKAQNNPALSCISGGCAVGVDAFDNYTPAGAVPDYDWSIDSSVAEFGFTIDGTAASDFFKDAAGTCGSGGTDNTDKCWYPLETTNRLIAVSSSANHTQGQTTSLKFYAQIGSSKTMNLGIYSAAIVLTAVPN
ncbi:MAG TPA: hypothetical protein PKL98_02920 [Candidatus Pacearchaeota archaeon]|mgnify:FL=1|nr:hypothetical protein [Candidatus Pacearchaeota archaeon]